MRLAPRCDVCHLDYEFADPAAFTEAATMSVPSCFAAQSRYQ
ncbi:hypothetical protein [Agrobacterium bohemicum]